MMCLVVANTFLLSDHWTYEFILAILQLVCSQHAGPSTLYCQFIHLNYSILVSHLNRNYESLRTLSKLNLIPHFIFVHPSNFKN